MKNEKQFTTKFNNWLKEQVSMTAGYELKFVRGNKLNFKSCFPEHQRRCLRMLGGKRFVYKISDGSVGQKPFDVIRICESPGFLVIYFVSVGGFYIIEITKIINLINNGVRGVSAEDCSKLSSCNKF